MAPMALSAHPLEDHTHTHTHTHPTAWWVAGGRARAPWRRWICRNCGHGLRGIFDASPPRPTPKSQNSATLRLSGERPDLGRNGRHGTFSEVSITIHAGVHVLCLHCLDRQGLKKSFHWRLKICKICIISHCWRRNGIITLTSVWPIFGFSVGLGLDIAFRELIPVDCMASSSFTREPNEKIQKVIPDVFIRFSGAGPHQINCHVNDGLFRIPPQLLAKSQWRATGRLRKSPSSILHSCSMLFPIYLQSVDPHPKPAVVVSIACGLYYIISSILTNRT